MEVLDEARTNSVRRLMLANKDSIRKYETEVAYAQALQEWYDNVQLAETLDRAKNNTNPRGTTCTREKEVRGRERKRQKTNH